jgi:hypothetical protein
MKQLLVVSALLSIYVSAFAQGRNTPPTRPSKIEQELRNLVTTWNDAEIKKDVATIEKLLAPEFSFLGGSSRSEYLEKVVPDPSVKYFSTIDDIKVELYGNSAIVTTLDSVKGGNDKRALEGRLLILTVWLRRGGRWQCVKSCIQVVNVQVHEASIKRLQPTPRLRISQDASLRRSLNKSARRG